MVVYISEKNARHGPRLEVSQSYGDKVRKDALFSVTIERNPRIVGNRGDISSRDIGLIFEFIDMNMQLLLAYWEQDPGMDTLDMLQALRKVEYGSDAAQKTAVHAPAEMRGKERTGVGCPWQRDKRFHTEAQAMGDEAVAYPMTLLDRCDDATWFETLISLASLFIQFSTVPRMACQHHCASVLLLLQSWCL